MGGADAMADVAINVRASEGDVGERGGAESQQRRIGIRNLKHALESGDSLARSRLKLKDDADRVPDRTLGRRVAERSAQSSASCRLACAAGKSRCLEEDEGLERQRQA
jgi:hypothetical protein